MRKRLLACLCAAALLLSCGCALAELSGAVQYDEGTGQVSISVSDLYPDIEYSIIILREGASALGASALVFADQVSSTADGTLSIAFIHMNIPDGNVYIGGDFKADISPWKVGSVRFVPEEDVALLPSALTEIPIEAFMGATFSHVYIGDQVESIGARAFKNCTSLQTVHIPDSVQVFGDDIFENCGNVTIVCGEDSMAALYAEANGINWRTE